MAKYRVVVEDQADKDIRIHLRSGDKSVAKKIYRILDELTEHPETGIGQPEQLRFQLSGY